MAVRAFTTSDILDCASGALATGTFGTQAIIVKRSATGAWHTFLALHNSGGSALTQFAYSSGNLSALWVNGDTSNGPAAVATTAWGLVVVRKATGGAIPRFSVYNFTAGTWSHAAGSLSLPNWTAPGASGTVRFRWESFDQFAGRVAVRAAWNSLPWSADTTGDAALEAAGLHTSLQKWVDATPSALWAFNQDAVTTAVTDLTGGGANQTARTGTTVVTGDDPPGFSFTLGGGDQTVTPSAVATGEAFGTATVTPGPVTVTPGGVASAETFGAATVQPGPVTVSPSGVSTGEAFGSPTLSVGTVTITPSAVGSAEAFGDPTLTVGPVTVTPGGVASGESFGSPTVSSGGLITPSGIPSSESFGSPVIAAGPVTVTPTGIASAETSGIPTVGLFVAPVGVGTQEMFGAPTVHAGEVTIVPVSISAGEVFGTAAVTGGQTFPPPLARTFSVTAESRVMVVPADSRRSVVAADDRMLEVT
jgi:hypothetical protein